ncbi:MAG TPA: AlkA N-terminal domain-containing protein [Bryobacteraceae bacterium]|nr:AlkA N-terminal domain-containing protein [Bryobacteraceae bacterium]
MDLSRQTCEIARRSRDPRFDGRFFIGVTTTGIYCRPVCPAPSPKESNVRYFVSAASAAEAGFRPCLRCHPETSPGTPAWLGTSTTVSRALRLMDETALSADSLEDLSARLGVGSRQLRRLFLKHLGASPVAVAQTRRLHFAKTLIDQTDLPFTEAALASGFKSIRRFNASFQTLYGRTPTELRGLARRKEPGEPGRYRFRLPFRPPFDWDDLLEFLSPRAIPGVEELTGGSYRRTIALQGKRGLIEARLDSRRGAVDLLIQFPDAAALIVIVERVRRLFDLRADPADIQGVLGPHPLLARRVAARPGLRVPGAWDGFEMAVRAILGQQVTVRGASTLAGRIVRAFGDPWEEDGGRLTHFFPAPATLAAADYSRIGLPAARAETIRRLASAVESGELTFSGVADPARWIERFRALPGVGEWTAQYVAMRALGEPDAFPAADLGLLRASGAGSPKQLEQTAEAWRPWRAYAAMHLWQAEGESE